MGEASKVGAAGQSRAVPEQKKTKVSKEQKEKIDNIFKATAEKIDKIKSDAEINAAKAAQKSANDDALKLRNRNTALLTMKNKSYKNIDLNLAQTEKNLTAINNRYADVELKLRANRQLALKIHNDKDATEFQKAAYEKASSAVNDALHELKIITGQEIDAADLKLDENGRLVGSIKRSGKLTSEQIKTEKKAFSEKKSTDKSVTFSDKTLKHYEAVHHKQSEQEKAVREQALTKMGESSAEAKTVTDNVKNLETKRAERAKMSKEIKEKSNEKVVAVVQSTVADLEKTETGKEPVKKEDKTGASSKPGKDAASAAKEALEKTKSEQGPIGKLWSGFKNLTGIGASSDKAEKAIKDFENGKITREEMEKAVKNYQEGQEEVLDIAADVGAGIISAGVFTVCAGAGLVAAPFTGGASLGLVLGGFGLSASVGAVAKTGIKAGDAFCGGRKYDSLGYDLATGAAGGVFAPFTAGLGGATAKKVGTYCVKKGMTAAKARWAAKLANVAGMSAGGAIDGGTYSAAAYVTGDAENKNLVDFSKEVAKGAKVGAVAGPVVGGAFHGLGKLCSKGASAVKKILGKSGSAAKTGSASGAAGSGSAGSAAKTGAASGAAGSGSAGSAAKTGSASGAAGSGSAGSAAKTGAASSAAGSQSKTASCISIDDFKKAGNTFKNGKAVTPDGKDFEGTVGRLTGKTENGVDCYSKSTYKNGVRETLESYEGDKLVSSVKYEYDQATGKVAKIIETDAATGNQVNKAFEYVPSKYNQRSINILKTDKDGKNLGKIRMCFDGKSEKLYSRVELDSSGKNVLNKYEFINGKKFNQTIKDGQSVSGSNDVMYTKMTGEGLLFDKYVAVSNVKNGKKTTAVVYSDHGNKFIVKRGSKQVMRISKALNGEEKLTMAELPSPAKVVSEVRFMSEPAPDSMIVKKWGNRRLEVQAGSRDRVLYDTSKGGKSEIASSKGGKIFKDGAEVDTANLKAKIGDTEITSDNLDSYTIGTEKYKYDNSGGTKVLVDEKGAPVTDHAVIDKINQFEKQFEWLKEIDEFCAIAG